MKKMKDTYLSSKAFKLEKKMVKFALWQTTHPEAYKVAMNAHQQGIPAGIAHDEELGWCVLMSGQGPYIAWAENKTE